MVLYTAIVLYNTRTSASVTRPSLVGIVCFYSDTTDKRFNLVRGAIFNSRIEKKDIIKFYSLFCHSHTHITHNILD